MAGSDVRAATSLLAALPDLAAYAPGAPTLPLYGRPGARALPGRLDLARRDDGSPWLTLTIGRRADLSPGSAFLDLGLRLGPANGSAAWQEGWLVLEVLGIDAELEPTTDVTAVPVWPAGPAGITALLDLDVPTALLLRGALEDGAPLSVRAGVTVAVDGVAARADRRVDLDLGSAATLLRPPPGEPKLTRDDVLAVLRAASGLLDGPPGEPVDDAAAEALADRLLSRCVPLAPTGPAAPVRFSVPDTLVGRAVWDLTEPVRSVRHVTVELDPLAAAAALLGPAPGADLVRYGTIGVLDAGRRAVTVHDTLPDPLAGVELLSVQLAAPPAPPDRVQTSSALVTARPHTGADDPVAVLRLAPQEPLAYTWRTALVPSAPAMPRRLLGPVRSTGRAALRVTPLDLPARLATVTASTGLLAAGRVVVTTRWVEPDGAAVSRDDEIASGAVHLAIPMEVYPAVDDGAVLRVTLRAADGTGEVDLGERPFGPWFADLEDVPTLGARTVELALDVPAAGAAEADTVVALELRADDEGSPTPVGLVVLTGTAPRATWTYVCTDPFRPGVRHRPFRTDGDPAPWSDTATTGPLVVPVPEVVP